MFKCKIKISKYADGHVSYTPIRAINMGVFHFIMNCGYDYITGPECCLIETAREIINLWKFEYDEDSERKRSRTVINVKYTT